MQGARVQSWVRELDPTCMPQLRARIAATKIPRAAATKTRRSQISKNKINKYFLKKDDLVRNHLAVSLLSINDLPVSMVKIQNQNLEARRHWLNKDHVWKYFCLERVSILFYQSNVYWKKSPETSLSSTILIILRLGDLSYFYCQFPPWVRGQKWLEMPILTLPVSDLKMVSQMNSTITYWGYC